MSDAKQRIAPTDSAARRAGLDPIHVRTQLAKRVHLHAFTDGRDPYAWVMADSITWIKTTTDRSST